TCTATYPLPLAGFIEPAPEFLCRQCRVPRVKITFRGVRPDLYCINPECPEHHKAFRLGVCPSCGRPLEVRYSFQGKRFGGCSGYPECRTTYPLPQRGKLEISPEPCPECRAPIVTAIEAGRPPWKLCINPACPSRIREGAAKEERAKARAAAQRKKSRARSPAARAAPASDRARRPRPKPAGSSPPAPRKPAARRRSPAPETVPAKAAVSRSSAVG
ncbi:DNA topoisomerase I, partial [mine drainage metagenome]